MNIDSIKNYPNGSTAKLKHRQNTNVLEYNKESADLCENKSVNRGYYSGSFTGINMNRAAAKSYVNLGNTFGDKIFRSDKFKWLNAMFEEQSVIGQALVALFVAGGLRPATNLAMATDKDREDSIYAASHVIASAVIGFVVSSIVMAPFGAAFKKIKENPEKYLKGLEDVLGVEKIGPRKLEKSMPYKKLSKIAQFIPDTLVLGIPKAMLTIALIPPILKYVFHMEKGKKKGAPQVAEVTNQKMDYAKTQLSSSAFDEVKGGVK